MIVSFSDKETRKICNGELSKVFPVDLQELARRKLRMLNNSGSLTDMIAAPSNKPEKLKGNLKGFWSIRLNDDWRIVFKWNNGDAGQVEVVDYN
jgi:proteic killer suppression protein